MPATQIIIYCKCDEANTWGNVPLSSDMTLTVESMCYGVTVNQTEPLRDMSKRCLIYPFKIKVHFCIDVVSSKQSILSDNDLPNKANDNGCRLLFIFTVWG